jgi:hypothetical protein
MAYSFTNAIRLTGLKIGSLFHVAVVHGIPLYAPLLHLALAGEDSTQTTNGTAVSIEIFPRHGASFPVVRLRVSRADYLNIRVTLLKPGAGEVRK